MNKVVRTHYPVDCLPDDLKTGLPAGATVRIEIEFEGGPAERRAADLVGAGRNVHGSTAEVLAHLRALRDED